MSDTPKAATAQTATAQAASAVGRTTFEREAVWLPQLAADHLNADQYVIDGKTFTDCVIEGPAVLMATDNVIFDGCNFGVAENPRSLLMQPLGPRVIGAVAFSNTRFVRCRFALVGFTGHPDFLKSVEDGLNANRASAATGS